MTSSGSADDDPARTPASYDSENNGNDFPESPCPDFEENQSFHGFIKECAPSNSHVALVDAGVPNKSAMPDTLGESEEQAADAADVKVGLCGETATSVHAPCSQYALHPEHPADTSDVSMASIPAADASAHGPAPGDSDHEELPQTSSLDAGHEQQLEAAVRPGKLRRPKPVKYVTNNSSDSESEVGDWCSDFSEELNKDKEDSSSSSEVSLEDMSQGSIQGLPPASDHSHSPVALTSGIEENSTPVKKSLKEASKEESDEAHITILPINSKKINFCFFCKVGVQKLARHLSVHAEKHEVQEIFALPKQSIERKHLIEVLRNKGNYLHNDFVLNAGKGVIVPKKRSSSLNSESNMCFCPHCFGTFYKDTLSRHAARCPKKPEGLPKGVHCQLQGKRLVAAAQCSSGSFRDFQTICLPVMKKDKIYELVARDPTILLYGSKLLSSHKDQEYLVTYVTTKCREVARVLQAAMGIDSSVTELKELFDPSKWDLLLAATKKEAEFHSTSNSFNVPTLALKIGHSMKTIAGFLMVECIKSNDTVLENNLNRFLKLKEVDWRQEISSKAHKTLYEKKFNKHQPVPIAEDVQKLYTFLKLEIAKCQEQLLTNESPATWYALAKSTASYVLIFNRRRPGELSRMKITAYQQEKSTHLDEEIAKCLSESEKLLAKSLVLVQIRGKRGRKVPVLLNHLAVSAIDALLNARAAGNIKSSNPYIFATPGSDKSMRLSWCFKECVEKAGCVKTEALCATNLRKHVATTCQILDLHENELDQLANFMGHDLSVHRDFYRLSSDAVTLARVSKVFTLMDQGKITKWEGKSLTSIEVNGESLSDDVSSDSEPEPSTSHQRIKGKKTGKHQKRRLATDSDTEDEDLGELPLKPRKKSKVKQRAPRKAAPMKLKGVKRAWSEEETSAVKRHLRTFMMSGKVPGKKPCLLCIENSSPSLDKRSWTDVKYYVKNYIEKKKKNNQVSPFKIGPMQSFPNKSASLK